ncbi:hypothetical protein EST38_g7485 [Candolleomyces aberdarensis]|uniref:F-box protein n=1 Tax=Candolleomyces aberdarensis TaxID=2316362 RepID=A0A4V1Q3F0_9AGAR|nr:hypothetical protein EST38_g7485 [Candolleomyces aberdarensis]
MLNIPAAHTQCLERLDITLDYDFFSSHKDSPYYSESAPDLLTPVKSNSLNLMLHPEVEMKEIPINWSGLTHLTFSTRRYHFQAISPQGFEALEWTGMCLSLLSSCPNLEYCDFQMPQLWSSSEPWQLTDDVTTARMISLPNLRSLKISRISEVPLGFASRLELPVLENLTLMCEYTDPEPKEGSQSSLLEFVQRFGPTLLKSTIHYIDLTQQSLYECLQSLPNVVTLRLTGERGCSFAQHAGLTGELLKKMNGKKRLCPKLQNLALRLGSRDDLTHAILTDFIIARRPAARSNSGQSSNATLRSLKIKLHGTSGSKFTIRENLALRRAEIEDLEGFVLTEEFGSRQRPPWEIRAVDPDLNF